ncbi:putative high light inducible protein [Synechococcus phage S-CBWM1]|uniref:Putative high light inducible protein n=1 Tax=Synechococcus phage S-CBWM1 TaxID=2053653 RepID=A0A3G1L3S5_9CAUD|nr:high light inducible protein [Synechococcus phage S-CBWM1]ATW62829.1 putative high light inducible protein [Synechococcus phage S-CBWM1]
MYTEEPKTNAYLVFAERINGLMSMIGFAAAIGSYALTGQIIPGVW